jgi:hypothetical protein
MPALAVALATGARATTERSSLYAEHAGLLALPSLLSQPVRRVPIAFWNHSALGALALLVPLSLAIWAFLSAPRALAGSPALAPLRLLGRHALLAYVLHLGLLGVIALAGYSPQSALVTWSLIGGLTLVSLAAALPLDRRAQSAPASAGAAAAQTRTS